MTKSSAGWLLVVVLSTGACASMSKVRTHYEPDEDFSTFETFAVPRPDPAAVDADDFTVDVDDSAHRAAVEAMEAKGYRQSSEDEADLLVNLHAKLDEMVTVGPYNYKVPKEYWVGHYPGTTQYEYRQGVLTVDVVERDTRALLWRGWAERRLKGGQRPAAADVARATTRIIEKFPDAADRP